MEIEKNGHHAAGEQPADPGRALVVEIRCGALSLGIIGETTARDEELVLWIIETLGRIKENPPPKSQVSCGCPTCTTRKG